MLKKFEINEYIDNDMSICNVSMLAAMLCSKGRTKRSLSQGKPERESIYNICFLNYAIQFVTLRSAPMFGPFVIPRFQVVLLFVI